MTYTDIRDKIDVVDDKILALLEKRVELAKKIGKAKREKGLPILDAGREDVILKRLTKNTPLKKEFIRKHWEHIIGYCRENE